MQVQSDCWGTRVYELHRLLGTLLFGKPTDDEKLNIIENELKKTILEIYHHLY